MNENVCNDNRFNLIAKYKAKLIEATNIETSQDEMAVIDNILFRMWQMGWLDKLDAASPWHRVEDDPPDEKDDAIFYYEWTGTSGTVYRETSIVSFCELIALGCRPIAWMPLPEPPKEVMNE